MTNSPDWLKRVDDHILKFMKRCDGGDALVSPKVIAANIHYGNNYVGRRLREELVPRGLVSSEGSGLYKLTDLGRRYLAGDLDAGDIPSPENAG